MKARSLLVAALASAAFIVPAAPAGATCQTNPDLGDVCTPIFELRDRLCENKIYQKVGNCP